MATVTAAPTHHETHKRNTHRRRQVIGRRRRVGGVDKSDEGGQDTLDLGNSDSLSEESTASDGGGLSNGSNTSSINEKPPTAPVSNKSRGSPKQAVVCSSKSTAAPSPRTQTKVTNDSPSTALEPQTSSSTPGEAKTTLTAPRAAQPAIVSSSAAPPPRRETAYERQRREHDLYKQRRDEDPSFVPNRGAFFMHDHRGAGPAANGFRPFNRSGRGSRGRGSFGGSYLPMHSQFHQADLTANQSWAHDMHEVVTQPQAQRLPIPQRQNIDSVSQYGTSRYASSQYAINQYASSQYAGSQYGGSQYGGSRAFPPVPAIPTCPPSLTPIDRSMSVEKPLGTVTVRVMFPPMKEPAVLEKFMVTQYTKLPDHRPPLRRDKAVVIDLPGHPRRQIFPAVDRSFIFIPRASRPNQQRTHGGRNRSVMGSFSGFSHRTSVFGGSYYNGSMYSPSVALSRRSSFAQDGGRDFIISPAASVISRPPHTMETTARPVVRLPPTAGLHTQPSYPIVGVQGPAMHTAPPSIVHPVDPVSSQYLQQPSGGRETTLPTDTRPIHQIQRESHLQPAQSAFQSSKPAENIQPYSSQPGEQASTQQPKQPSGTSSLSTVPLPQHHPLPQKPVFQENRPDNNLPMHQPRPQKTVSVENLETPVALGTNQPSESQPYSMAFHQQVPLPMTRGLPPTELHSRHSSYQSHTTGTPLPQIPERAIHAAPFQPIVPPNKRQMTYPHLNNMGAPSGAAYYGGAANAYVLEQAPQQGYYYPTPPSYPPNTISTASVSPYVPGGAPQASAPSYSQHSQAGTGTPLNSDPRKMVAQEVNGMVYYVDVSQLPAMSSYTGYGQVPMSQAGYMPNAGGMIAPVPAEGYYYEGQPSMAYY